MAATDKIPTTTDERATVEPFAQQLVVQHAEKEPGDGDPPLTSAGVEQARRAGAFLREQGVTRLFSSPLRRATIRSQGRGFAGARPLTCAGAKWCAQT